MGYEDVAKLLESSTDLPSIPAVAQQLLAISEWEDVDLKDVADLIVKDVALTAKILKLVNSSYYGFPREVRTMTQALTVLGLRATRSITLTFSLLEVLPAKETAEFDYAAFWTRSLNTATAARQLAIATRFVDEEEAFLAGLLQDIGVMLLVHCCPDLYAPVLRKAKDGMTPRIEIEREYLGTDHAEIVTYLFHKWNLPSSLHTPLKFHHAPEGAAEADSATVRATHIQHVAGLIGEWLYYDEPGTEAFKELEDIAARELELSPDEFKLVVLDVDRKMDENSHLFSIVAPRPHTYAELMKEANLALGEIVNEKEILLIEFERSTQEAQKLSEQLRIANNKLLDQNQKDPLTDIANRRKLEEFCQSELSRCRRFNHCMSLLFIDIDDFKSLNDRYGHPTGDAALIEVSRALKERARACDLAARYGGEEFVVALVETDDVGAAVAGEKFCNVIRDIRLRDRPDRSPIALTVSIGIATWNPTNASISLDDLVARADTAMYAAKKAGKDCVRAWRPGP